MSPYAVIKLTEITFGNLGETKTKKKKNISQN